MSVELGPLQHSPFAVIATAADLTITAWNGCAERLLGAAAGAAIGRSLAAVVPHPGGEAGWRELLAGDGATPASFAIPRGGGPALVCEWQRQDHAGGALWFCRDVTDRYARTLHYRQQEFLLRAIVENLDVVVWAVDTDGTFTFHEGKALAAAGLRPRQFLGQNIYELYADQAGNASIRAAMHGASDHQLSTSHGIIWESWFVPVRDEDGAIVGCAGVTMDVTTRSQRETELQAKLDVIEQQQRVIRQLGAPIIEVWDSVLTVPMVGLVDATRAADIMDDLLQAVTRTRARFAVLDLTGIDSLDTATASHLVRLISALKLLGAEGIVTGIHPSVARTMVELGVDLSAIPVHADLRSALKHCIARLAASALADVRR
jgi:rsbT co-antagonist protein RsbR